jgi:BirA family biotin operon repressor/biotin-[acetyl-CoA-carboxylase] ligase
MSVILMPARARVAPERATALVTLAAGVALTEGVERASGLQATIKWPNDLLVGRRKLAGILAEGVATASRELSVVVGLGLNVGAAAAYPVDLANRATSLEGELGRPIDRALVCVETLAALAARYDDLLDGRYDAILDAWQRHAPGSHGARVAWDAAPGRRSGVTAGVDATGALLVRHGSTIERLVAGEVTWL